MKGKAASWSVHSQSSEDSHTLYEGNARYSAKHRGTEGKGEVEDDNANENNKNQSFFRSMRKPFRLQELYCNNPLYVRYRNEKLVNKIKSTSCTYI